MRSETTRTRLAAACLLAAALLLNASCASIRRRPVDTLGAATPEAAWAALSAARETFTGARAFMTIRPDGGRRFDATLEIDRRGKVALHGLSPLGTTLFRLYASEDRVLFLNDRAKTWWEGSFEEFSARTGLFRGIGIDRPSDLALLLVGLPASSTQDEIAGLRYRTTAGGLAEVFSGTGSLVYEPAVYPPLRIRIETPSSAMTIEHQEIVMGDGVVEIPQPDPSWRCCELPSAAIDPD